MRTLSLMIAALAILAGCQTKEDKVIAITFDDGPNVTTTVKMLDMLEKHGSRVFFVADEFYLKAKGISLPRSIMRTILK